MNQELQQWPIEKLIPYARNPRKNDHAVDRIASAIKEFGFRVPLLAKSDGSLVDGHLRLKAAQKLNLETVPVLLCDDMTDVQIKAFRISVNRMAELADWDTELLSLEMQELVEVGFDSSLTGFDSISSLAEPFDFNPEQKETTPQEKSEHPEQEQDPDNPYTQKIESPVYEPKGEKPELAELFNTQKTDELVAEIEKADVPVDVKAFLTLAAQRHTVFDFGKIAEFYCHSPKSVQELMEKSALVIIDFNKAIESGFVQLSKELADLYKVETDGGAE